jgi:hypothetical protein
MQSMLSTKRKRGQIYLFLNYYRHLPVFTLTIAIERKKGGKGGRPKKERLELLWYPLNKRNGDVH